MSKFYETDSEARWWAGIFGRVVIAIVLISLIGLGFFVFRTVTAEPKGRADAYRQQRSAANRIAQQAQFEDRFQDIQASDRKLDQARVDAAAGDENAKIRYTGLLNYCEDAVAEYNANSRKYLAADFKSIDLPYQIDPTDPTTDCKPGSSK